MGSRKDSLGDRMKRYESVPKNFLTRRTPVIIRVDGKAFHTFTRGMKKPFDEVLMKTMKETMKYLCENVQGCVLGYTQSDEITLVLTDYATLTTDAWFGYNVQKCVSIVASMATMAFNKHFAESVREEANVFTNEWLDDDEFNPNYKNEELRRLWSIHKKAQGKGAMFDARIFNLPKEEVCNCLIWRQQDATRNSIQSVGQAYFSHKELNNKTCNNIQEMLWQEHGINWNDFSVECKRGSCCIKERDEVSIENSKTGESETVSRSKWVIDTNIPIFTKERGYVENLL